jgi:hypothetical protein
MSGRTMLWKGLGRTQLWRKMYVLSRRDVITISILAQTYIIHSKIWRRTPRFGVLWRAVNCVAVWT